MNCSLCNRPLAQSKHHLIPVQKGGKHGSKTPLCILCHNQLHDLFNNKELKILNSIEKLKANEKVQKYLKWLLKHPNILKLPHTNKGVFHN